MEDRNGSDTDLLLHANMDPWTRSVRWHDVTLATPAENLALDEVLLLEVDADPSFGVIRTWEPSEHFVVVGRSNRIETEVNAEQCVAEQVPILRRSSGGGTVIIGPGCLAYSLIMPITPELRAAGVVPVTKSVMEIVASTLNAVVPGTIVQGTSDLALNDRKFSGNAQRWLKNAFLHHGTILHDYELDRVERLLRFPSREPDYRSHRTHREFVTNIRIPRHEIVCRLVAAWRGILTTCEEETLIKTRLLAASKYESQAWNHDR